MWQLFFFFFFSTSRFSQTFTIERYRSRNCLSFRESFRRNSVSSCVNFYFFGIDVHHTNSGENLFDYPRHTSIPSDVILFHMFLSEIVVLKLFY